MCLKQVLLAIGGLLLACSAYPTPSPAPSNPSLQQLNNVIVGVRVLDDLAYSQVSPGDLYDPSNATQERGFYVFSVLLQSLQTLDILERSGLSSDDLTIFRVVVDGILSDTCRWFKTYNNATNCNDRSSFAATLLSMGLRPHLRNLKCFLNGLGEFTNGQEPEYWIQRTFNAPVEASQNQTDTEDLKCHLCSKIHLGECCALSR